MKTKSRHIQDLGFSLVIVLSCVFSPYLWIFNLIILIIPIGYLLKSSSNDAKRKIAMSVFLLNSTFLGYDWLNPFAYVVAQLFLITALALEIKLMERICV